MNIGVLGGTFNPIHRGHIIIAEETRTQLDLAEVHFVPTAQTPLKEDSSILSAEHRVQMVCLAIADYPHFKLSTIEIDRPGPSYTVDTITELWDKLGAENELFFIVGCGSLAQFSQWKEPSRIIQMCRLVAVPRPGYSLPDLNSLEAVIPGLSERLIVLDKPEIDISATEIRKRVAQGLSIRHLAPEPVEEYINKNRLYLKH
ncbi:putative nicotinate-nucleotide adenylyltransferase [subsurface metagenome]